MCLGPDAKGEFGVGRRAIRRESGASGGTGGARMGGRCAVEKLAGVPRGSKAQVDCRASPRSLSRTGEGGLPEALVSGVGLSSHAGGLARSRARGGVLLSGGRETRPGR